MHVGGVTAGGQDFSHVLSPKLPLFVGIVVILAFLLLAAVFRSLLIPFIASIMNLLSIGAALGVMTATFQYGWGKAPLNLAKDGPIDVFVPVLLFAVLFGLSMDYEVFLVSPDARGMGQDRRQCLCRRAGPGPRPVASSQPPP